LGPLPPAGSLEFGRYLLELAAHDPRVVPIISQAVLKGELPPEDQLALLRQVGEKIRGASAVAQGGEGGRVQVSQGGRMQGQGDRPREAEGPSSAYSSVYEAEDVHSAGKPLPKREASTEPSAPSLEETFRAPSSQRAKGGERGEGARTGGEGESEERKRSGYKAYEKRIRGKQRAERGIQRLLKQFEPNLRTFVLHPRKVLLWVLVPVLLVGSYWVFEQPIKAQMTKLRHAAEQQGQGGPPPPPPQGEPPSQGNQPPPPPPPQEAGGASPQEGVTPPSVTSPSSGVDGATGGAPQGETGSQNQAPQAQGPQAEQAQGPQAEGGGAQPPAPPPPPSPGMLPPVAPKTLPRMEAGSSPRPPPLTTFCGAPS